VRRRVALVAIGLCALSALALLGPGAAVSSADGGGPDGVVTGQVDSYAMRVEYDIPLPVGSGTVAHVIGEIRRSQAGENSKGLAGAPTELDAVVSGKYVDPQGTGHPERNKPQTECFYPGSLVNTSFFFPTDTQAETAGLPPVGYVTARCSAGPELELHAVDSAIGTAGSPTEAMAPVATATHVTSTALTRPVRDVLDATTESHASGVSAFGGILTIGAIDAMSHSLTDGQHGGAHSRSDVTLSDVAVGGVHFSLSNSSVDGQDQVLITVAGQTVPLDSSAGSATLSAANAALNSAVVAAGGSGGCDLTVVTSPATYPQGSLFRRDPPQIGVEDDGTLAASYRGGLLVVCDIPRSVSEPTSVSPQRAQVLFGFAFSSTAAKAEIGGFGLGDLVGDLVPQGPGQLGGVLAPAGPPLDALDASAGTLTEPAVAAPAARTRARPALIVGRFHMDGADRWLLAIIGVIGWAVLTGAGVRRFVLATSPCDSGTTGESD
jgi:hypothetical protein